MKLSMSLLAWYLRDYQPEKSITQDEMTICGLRFLSDANGKSRADYAYFGEAKYYFSDSHYKNVYILVCKKNYLIFWDTDYEELLNALLSSFDYFINWERRLLTASVQKYSLQNMIDIASEVIENPMMVIDLEGDAYALAQNCETVDDPYWDYMVAEHKEHVAVLNESYYTVSGDVIYDLSEKPQLVKNVYPSGKPVIMLYLKQDGEPVACLGILQHNSELTQMNLQIAGMLNHYLVFANEFVSVQAPLRSGERTLRGFLENKIKDDADGKSAIKKLQRKGFDGSWRLGLIRHITRGDQIQKRALLRALTAQKDILAFEYHKDILALVKGNDCRAITSVLKHSLQTSNICVGMSMVSSDFYAISQCYQQAVFTVGQAKGKKGIYQCEDYAFSYLIQLLRSQEFVPALLHPALHILEQYDEIMNTDLRNSLSVYLRKEGNILQAAQELKVHRNTLKYRLRRIQELTDLKLEDENELAYLRLSDWLE